jgi:hypothetical protein
MLMKVQRGSVYTDFKKSVDGGAGLSFSPSGARMMDTGCYAQTAEMRYKGLNAKLLRHYQSGPIWVLNKAIAELADVTRIDWMRYNVDGSLRLPGELPKRQRKPYRKALRRHAEECLKRGAEKRIHVVVESWNKAQFLRSVFKGLPIVVRRTVQGTLKDVMRAKDPVAWVVGEPRRGCITKKEKMRNLAEAFAIAKRIRAAGKSCVVCGAVCGSTKCGKCLACAIEQVDVVLYAFHG